MKLGKAVTKPLLPMIVAIIIVMTSTNVALAAEDNLQMITTPGNSEVNITYTQSPEFIITIPKSIEIDSTEQTLFTMNVKGDIEGDHILKIYPTSTGDAEHETIIDNNMDTLNTTIKMVDKEGKQSVDITVQTEYIRANSDSLKSAGDTGIDIHGRILAPNLTAGDWVGTIVFSINYTKVDK